MQRRFTSGVIAMLICITTAVNWHLSAFALEIPALHVKAREMANTYKDTVGWLKIQGTDIDEAVVQSTLDRNAYYLRRNYKGELDFNGSYFADYRCDFSAKSKTSNIVIYGHSFSDDVTDGNRIVRFDELKRYKSEDFIKQNPYIYFATKDKTFAYEVFAVSIMDVHVFYNNPNPDEKDLLEIVDQVRANSIYKFDNITINGSDKLLTLSTADYSSTIYPNDYRFVVMARRVNEVASSDTPQILSDSNRNPQTGK